MISGEKLFIIGTGRSEQSTATILEQFRPFISNVNEASFTVLKNNFAYKQLDGKNPDDFSALNTFVQEMVKKHTLGNLRIMFLSLPPESFCTYTKHSVSAKLIESHNIMHRVIFEKPFGTDSKSAQEINMCITAKLNENQIYRIDHYLAKPIIHAIPSLSKENPIISSLWNNSMIESVHIILNETLDIQDRGSYYDATGLINDVIQNHALQILALIAMEPTTQNHKKRADLKAKALKSIRIEKGILGQYKGYRTQKGVDPTSKTETYASLTTYSDMPQWKGVPFYITAGKALAEKKTEVIIRFKGGNQLTLKIAPQEEILLTLNLEDITQQTKQINLSGSAKSLGDADAYQTILSQVINGQKDSTVSMPEIIDQWRITQSIKKLNLPLYEYKQGAQESEIMGHLLSIE
jgi:glucose-6-phosphate 1-dehydrogenase